MRYVIACLMAALCLFAQGDRSILPTVSRIKVEASDNSQLMETLSYLTDVHGPRLTGSPGLRQASDWVVRRLQSYGIENVHQEKWGQFGRSWAVKQSSVEILEPRYASLDAAPLAWSDSTKGAVTADVLYAPYGAARDTLDPKKIEEELDRYITVWKGKLRGKVVLLSRARELSPASQPSFARLTDKELSERAAAPEPVAKLSDVANLEIPEDPEEERRLFRSLPIGVLLEFEEQRQRLAFRRSRFLRDEGALAVLTATSRSVNGLVFAQGAGPWDSKEPLAAPSFALAREQYNRLVRLTEKKIPVRVRVHLDADISNRNEDAFNVIGEIPGGAKKDEVVMIGAHLDSWHSGTGATDNAAGSAVMIEVMRVLKALNLKLDRTVRIALWSGEEQGLLGSRAYVKEHFGDPETMKLTDAHDKLSGYFNLDNGTGKIRGVYLQENDAMRPLFESWLAPFRDQGAATISIRSTGGTDHLSFDDVGLPGFQFIQDPIEYITVTHHSQMDTLDHIQPADLMQAVQVIAAAVYQAANLPERLPRKPLPKPQVKGAVKAARTGS